MSKFSDLFRLALPPPEKTVVWHAVPQFDSAEEWQLFDLWWIGTDDRRIMIDSGLKRQEITDKVRAITTVLTDVIILWK